MLIEFFKHNTSVMYQIERTGFIEEYASFNFCRKYSGIGNFKMTIDNPSDADIQIVKESDFLSANGNCGVIKNFQLTSGNKKILIINGQELKALASRRIVKPLEGEAYVTFRQKPIEEIIQALLQSQLTNPADTNRQIAGTVVIDDTDRTANYRYDGRFKNLGETIITLAETYNIGWYASCSVTNGIVWHIYHGVNRQTDQAVNEPFLVSYKYDSVETNSIDYTYISPNWILAAGQGEAENRELLEIGSTTGLDRYEYYADCRNCKTTEELRDQANQKMASFGNNLVYKADLADNMVQFYKVQFNLGDMGTLQDEVLGLLNFRVTEISEVYDSGYFKIKIVFGYDKKTMQSILNQIKADTEPVLYT